MSKVVQLTIGSLLDPDIRRQYKNYKTQVMAINARLHHLSPLKQTTENDEKNMKQECDFKWTF
jgi:hypothetical protein